MVEFVRVPVFCRPLRRAPGEVQFGVSPGCGLVVTGLTEAETSWLLELPRWWRMEQVISAGQRRGIAAQRRQQIIELVREAGVLRPEAPDPGQALTVGVLGRGQVADLLTEQLAQLAGVRAHRLCERGDEPSPSAPVNLIVTLARDVAWPIGRDDHPSILPVVLYGAGVGVGPLVRPDAGPCLGCLDLHREDRDHYWPVVAHQLRDRADEQVFADPPVALAAVTLATVMVHREASADPVSAGVSWHWSCHDPELLTRVWSRHPRCPCRSSDPLVTLADADR